MWAESNENDKIAHDCDIIIGIYTSDTHNIFAMLKQKKRLTNFG